MNSSQIEKDPVRDEILNEARELFKRFGFKKTTMEDIARQIGKSKSSLYYYYKTKEEIFEAVVLQDLMAQEKLVAGLMEQEVLAEKKFHLFFTGMLAGVKEKASTYSVFRAELFENPCLIAHITKKRERFSEEMLKNILIYGISKGEVRMLSSKEIDVWAKTTYWTMNHIGGRLFVNDEHDYLQDHFYFLADAAFRGVKV